MPNGRIIRTIEKQQPTKETDMNAALKAYRQRNRQTAAMQLTDRINAAATKENAQRYSNTIDQLAFCADLLGVSLTSDNGERAATRLENKLIRMNK